MERLRKANRVRKVAGVAMKLDMHGVERRFHKRHSHQQRRVVSPADLSSRFGRQLASYAALESGF